jgi:hypothetical protein
MTIALINGEALPSPTDFQVGIMDISKAERNAKGSMIIERVATKRKLFFTYSFVTASDLQLILKKISETFFSVTYLDPQTKTYHTISCYCGDRNVGMIDYRNGIARYKDFTFNLIER